MPSQPPGASSSEATSSEYTDSETESETSSSNVSTPHLSASANRGVRGGPRLTRGASMNNSSGVIQDLDDAALADKMRKAQERLEGLDKHVADLRSRSVEQDALAKGKLPPEQTAAYLARVKELEIKRRELLERQMGVGEELQRVATTNGTLNNHRHGGTPRAQKENARRELVDRLRREEAAAQARLEAYKGGSFGAEAEAAHRTALARVEAAEAEAEAERERERVATHSAEGARRNLRRLLPSPSNDLATDAIGPIVRTTPGPIARTTPSPIVRTTPNRTSTTNPRRSIPTSRFRRTPRNPPARFNRERTTASRPTGWVRA